MFADDTTIFCIGDTADEAIVKLNRALQEVYDWCGSKQFTPHPGKSEDTKKGPDALGKFLFILRKNLSPVR